MIVPDTDSTPEPLWEVFVPIKAERWQVAARVLGKFASLYSPPKMKSCQTQYVNFLKAAYRGEMITVPVCLMIDIHIQRPKTVKREYPSVMPDLTNQLKFVEDCITKAGIWKDDGLVVMQITKKLYTETTPGSHIAILQMPE